ncbi:43277_t:CDS:2, partial [Gigaspora margarita]
NKSESPGRWKERQNEALYANALFRITGELEFDAILDLCSSKYDQVHVRTENCYLTRQRSAGSGIESLNPLKFHLRLYRGDIMVKTIPMEGRMSLLRPISSCESDVLDGWYANPSGIELYCNADNPIYNYATIVLRDQLPDGGQTTGIYNTVEIFYFILCIVSEIKFFQKSKEKSKEKGE